MIASDVAFERHDIHTLLGQIEILQRQMDCMAEETQTAIDNLAKERNFRIHIQRALRKQESRFSEQQKEQMRMVEHQLKEQESFVLGIKLNLANLSKSNMEQRSQLKKEQLKSATVAVEKKNLQNVLSGVK